MEEDTFQERIPIDMKKVDDLLLAGCKGSEVAAYFGVYPDTLYRRIEREKGMNFAAYAAAKRQKGESLLRAQQYAKALGVTKEGDNMMLIWLGKNRLDQTDNVKQDASPQDSNIQQTIQNAKENAKLREELKRLKEKYEPETGTEHLRSEQEA